MYLIGMSLFHSALLEHTGMCICILNKDQPYTNLASKRHIFSIQFKADYTSTTVSIDSPNG
jgi:hypothetical protein